MKKRIFTGFIFIVMLFVASFQEAEAVALHFMNKEKFELDYGAVLALDAGYYWDMTNNEGMEYPIYRPMHIELPLGFHLKSLTINGRDHIDHQHIRELIPLHVPLWVKLDSMRYDIKAEIVPDTITSPEILVSILNAYEPESAVLVDGNRVLLNKTVDYTEKEYPHIFDLGEDTLIIDANYTNGSPQYMYLPKMQVNSGNIVITNTFFDRRDNQNPIIVQKGGILHVTNSMIYASFIEQEGGLFQIENSHISFDDEEGENKGSIYIKGEDAKTEFVSGRLSGAGNIIVESGELDIKNGVVDASILMKGGSLNVSGGYFYNEIFIASNDCDISFSGGNTVTKNQSLYILYDKGITASPSSSFLADGYVFADNYNNMIFPIGRELIIENIYKGDEVFEGYTFSSIVPESYTIKETVAYQAAKRADVGLNGKDVKINGTTYEIYTPEGLAWLAISISKEENKLENGAEYRPSWTAYDIFKLMNNLDMTGYGEDWPTICLGYNILDGQGHRIYNLDVTGEAPYSFIDAVYEKGIVANLTIEGNICINKQRQCLTGIGGVFYVDGLVHLNYGQIINCAFIGSIKSEFIGSVVTVSGLVNSNYGKIENCYVNTNGGIIGGIRPNGEISKLEGAYPYMNEHYEVAKFVSMNGNSIENCYFAGDASFGNAENIRIYGFEGNSYNPGTITNCYEFPNISVETLNTNVQNHEQDAEYPWATWAVDSTKYNGYPFHVFEQTIQRDSISLKKVGQGNLVAKYITYGGEQTIKADTIVEIDVPKTLTLVASPVEGYSLEKIVFSPKNSEEIELEEIEAGKEFELAVSGGIITAYFKEDSIPTPEEPSIIEKDSTLSSTINGDSLIVQGGTENDALELNVSGITIPSLKINAGSYVSLSVLGDNKLGTIENSGTLIIQNVDGNLDVEIVNNGTFIDYTGTITKVSGFSIEGIDNETVKEGETVTLVASISTEINEGNVSYQWQRFINDAWEDVEEETIQTRAAVIEGKPNELIVSSSEAGTYRCLITYTDENISTTLTAYAEVSLDTSEPENPNEDTDDSDDTSRPEDTPTYYRIKVEEVCEGAGVQLSHPVVKEGGQVSIYVQIEEGYDAANLKVYFKCTPFGYWEEVEEGVQPGEYIIYDVWSDVAVKVEGVEKEEPTGMDELEGIQAYAKEGSIYVYTPNREEVTIVSMSGAILKHEEQVGWQSYAVNRGIYIVRVGEKVFKLKN